MIFSIHMRSLLRCPGIPCINPSLHIDSIDSMSSQSVSGNLTASSSLAVDQISLFFLELAQSRFQLIQRDMDGISNLALLSLTESPHINHLEVLVAVVSLNHLLGLCNSHAH